MANINLSGMTVEALIDLRKRVDEMLLERRAELQKQLERLGPLPWLAPQGLREAVEAHYGEGKSRRNIVLHQAKLGQVVAQNLVGLLQRSKVERSSRIS